MKSAQLQQKYQQINHIHVHIYTSQHLYPAIQFSMERLELCTQLSLLYTNDNNEKKMIFEWRFAPSLYYDAQCWIPLYIRMSLPGFKDMPKFISHNCHTDNFTGMTDGIVTAYSDGLVQERRNFSTLTMKLRLSCTNPSIWWLTLSAYWLPVTDVGRNMKWLKPC